MAIAQQDPARRRFPATIALFVVVIGGAVGLWSFSSDSANLRKFDSIRDGMTQAEVESILGNETVERFDHRQPWRLLKFWGASHIPIRARDRYLDVVRPAIRCAFRSLAGRDGAGLGRGIVAAGVIPGSAHRLGPVRRSGPHSVLTVDGAATASWSWWAPSRQGT